jgi:3',5'-cyclic AMP phosphodiesterase CpdA
MFRRLLRTAVSVAFGLCVAHAQSYFFIQMSDPQFGMYTDNRGIEQEAINFDFAIATANRLKPAFVVITGDLINLAGNRQELAGFKRIVWKLDPSIPLYTLPGNHDVGNEPTPESLAAYRERFGRDYYTFRAQDMEGIVLDGTLIQAPQKAQEQAAKQEQWARQEFEKAKAEHVPHIVVFVHQPFFLKSADEPDQYFNIPREARERWLAMFHQYGVEHIYAGHYHRNSEAREGSLEMVTTGPVGKPLGPDGSGIRIVRVRDGVFQSKFYGLGFIPASIDEMR